MERDEIMMATYVDSNTTELSVMTQAREVPIKWEHQFWNVKHFNILATARLVPCHVTKLAARLLFLPVNLKFITI